VAADRGAALLMSVLLGGQRDRKVTALFGSGSDTTDLLRSSSASEL